MSSYLSGMNVLVTGASDGIGAELAVKLALKLNFVEIP